MIWPQTAPTYSIGPVALGQPLSGRAYNGLLSKIMSFLKSLTLPAAAAALAVPLTQAGPARAAVVGSDASLCVAGKPSVQVRVSGFKRAAGTVRVVLYNQDGWLEKGGSLRKIRVPVTSSGPIDVCIAVPKPGRYGIAVHHDLNGNKDKDLSDGGGFSRNPKIGLLSQRPKFTQTWFDVNGGTKVVPVTLLYLNGLKIGPARG